MSKSIFIGSEVELLLSERRQKFSIVESRGDPETGRISFGSPVGKALLGHEEGDIIEIQTPSRVVETKVLKVY